MELARPWLLVLLPLCLLPLWWRRGRVAVRYSSFVVLPRDPLSRALELVERGLGATFVAATVLAASGPERAPSPEVRWSRGARLVFVLDQSASMFSPWSGSDGEGVGKLAIAKEAIRQFMGRNPGDQLALIGFGRSSILYSPLTSDHRRFGRTLELMNSDLRDTVIDVALLRALELLDGDESGVTSQAVILVSDGVGRVLRPEAIAQRFRSLGVDLYWVVIEGGRTGDEGLDRLMGALGSRGETSVVGDVNELPRALESIERLERRLVKAKSWVGARSWTRLCLWVALGALLALAAFAFGDRRARRVGAT